MEPPIPSVMGKSEWALLFVLSILWGGSFLFTGIAIQEIPPLTIAFIRLAIGALILHLVLRIQGLRIPSTWKVWGSLAVMGLISSMLPISLIAWAQTTIGAGLASILGATSPLFGMIFAHLFTPDERLSGHRLIGTVLGFCGTVVVIGPAALGEIGGELAAQLAVVAAAISSAMGGVFGRRFRSMGVTPLATATGQVTAASLLLVPFVSWFDRPWALPFPSFDVVSALLALAVLSTALAYLIFFHILAKGGAMNTLLVGFLVPASAVLMGSLVLGEHLKPQDLAGMVLIGMGLAVVDGRLIRT
jgi:drug/metabolite transporter (DMT)-like permease